MDAYEATQIVFSRIQRMEPEIVCEIIDYLLSQDNGDEKMIRLAFSSDALLLSLIAKAKAEVNKEMYKFHLPPPLINTNTPSPSPFLPWPSVHWDPLQLERPLSWQQEHVNHLNYRPLQVGVGVAPNYNRRDQILVSTNSNNSHNMAPSEFLFPGYLNNGDRVGTGQLKSIASSVSDVNITSVWKPCVYFARGYCKHGNNCRFIHGYSKQDNNNNNGCSLSSLSGSGSPTESRHTDEYFQNGSLEKLEIELQELLIGKRVPISIAALPQLYYERYGKTLQAEGYLTESQRHGKAGYSLTKLLARLKDTVTLIDRPHGQHAVVLAEDAHRFMLYRGGVDFLGGLNSSSRQIYMTFPAESTFTEQDVSNYFRTYGPVHDVRIPYQQKRMFGFVTFIYPETVKTILGKGNPHYVCGARVLVKPYREKGKAGDRKYIDKVEQPKYMSPSNFDIEDYEQMHLGLRIFDYSGPVIIQMENQEQAIELESRRLAEMRLASAEAQQMQLVENQASIIAASTDALVAHTGQSQGKNVQAHYAEAEESRVEDISIFSPTNHFGYLLDVLENNEDGPTQPTHESNDDEERYGHILPESPFGNTTESNGNGTLHNSEETKNLIGEREVTIPKISSQALSVSVINKQLACSMCLDALVDPKQFECNHAFCLNCMPRLVKLPRSKVMQELLGKRVVPASRVWYTTSGDAPILRV
ncbi:hypothetical protein SUGI_0391040 [Cryptomeria japonica]|uniref:zinc finger CCCH domain-containing protein 18 isoform X2 n=1 Tax=Cryptomeria japonica TaxID=3369 RepID=UPI002408A3E6|nr:zinc finger CCCH domain-containing protein 18 isoform X2 [Cryptomeria japonica]GLJ21290.1 hypothetical protein SUGI_0391040 [Cryptomeria japonica]